MEKKLGKETSEFKAFGDIWKFYQAYYIAEESDDYWNKMIEDGNRIVANYKDVPLAKIIVIAIIDLKAKEINCKVGKW